MLETVEKKSMSVSSIFTSIVTVLGTVALASTIIYGMIDTANERQLKSIKDVIKSESGRVIDSVITVHDLVTGEKFRLYTENRDSEYDKNLTEIVGYMNTTDSTLAVVLPSILKAQLKMERKLDLTDSKVNIQSAVNEDDRLDQILHTIQKMDSLNKHNDDIAKTLKIVEQLNNARFNIKKGDRAKRKRWCLFF